MTNPYADEALYALLCKYLLQEADNEERRWVEEWLHADPGHPVLLASLDKMLNAPVTLKVTAADTELAWQRLSREMPGDGQDKKRLPQQRFWLMAAAILLLLTGAGSWWLRGSNDVYEGPVVARLSDGSTVHLQAKARLEVKRGFGEKQREVKLKGGATFNVTADAPHPFIVNLDKQRVTVLGTTFTVEGFPLRVHVDTGKVMVTAGKDSVVLTAGMLLELMDGAFRVVSHVKDVAGRQMDFNDVPLQEVLETLELVYQLKVKADTALLSLPVTATFTGETAENVLAAIAFMTNTTVEKNTGGFVLKKHDNL